MNTIALPNRETFDSISSFFFEGVSDFVALYSIKIKTAVEGSMKRERAEEMFKEQLEGLLKKLSWEDIPLSFFVDTVVEEEEVPEIQDKLFSMKIIEPLQCASKPYDSNTSNGVVRFIQHGSSRSPRQRKLFYSGTVRDFSKGTKFIPHRPASPQAL